MGSEGGRRAINVQAKQGTATSRPGPQQQGHGRGVEAALKAGIEPSYGTADPPQRQEDQKAADHDVAPLVLLRVAASAPAGSGCAWAAGETFHLSPKRG